MKKIISSTPFLAIIACVLWASPFVPLKIGLEIMPRPLEFAGYRFLLAGFFIALFTGLNKSYFEQVKRNFRKIFYISIFHTSLLYSFFYLGQQRVDGAMGSLIVGSQPLFVVLFAHFMQKDDRLSLRKALCILLGILGLIIISFPKLTGVAVIGITPIIGILFLVGNNMTSAFSNVLISRTKTDRLDPLVFSSSQLMVGGVTLLTLSYIFVGFEGIPSVGIWWVCLAVLVFISTVAIGVWFVLLAREGVKVSQLNMWKFIIPVVGSIESWLLLPDESPDIYSVAGLLVLTSSLVLLYWGTLKQIIFKSKKSEIKIQ